MQDGTAGGEEAGTHESWSLKGRKIKIKKNKILRIHSENIFHGFFLAAAAAWRSEVPKNWLIRKMNANQDADSLHDVPVATETEMVLGFRVLPS
jgi:hypothetical protein